MKNDWAGQSVNRLYWRYVVKVPRLIELVDSCGSPWALPIFLPPCHWQPSPKSNRLIEWVLKSDFKSFTYFIFQEHRIIVVRGTKFLQSSKASKLLAMHVYANGCSGHLAITEMKVHGMNRATVMYKNHIFLKMHCNMVNTACGIFVVLNFVCK